METCKYWDLGAKIDAGQVPPSFSMGVYFQPVDCVGLEASGLPRMEFHGLGVLKIDLPQVDVLESLAAPKTSSALGWVESSGGFPCSLSCGRGVLSTVVWSRLVSGASIVVILSSSLSGVLESELCCCWIAMDSGVPS